MTDITLIVDFSEESGYYFVVMEGEETLCFRPGFRSGEEAKRIGDQWIRDNVPGALPKEE